MSSGLIELFYNAQLDFGLFSIFFPIKNRRSKTKGQMENLKNMT